nr:ribonuclease H-like domain-containing protein [Tanacetum cinerariifolium]
KLVPLLIVRRRKGKEIMVESDTPKKRKLQEQIDAQMAKELEEQQEKEDLRMNEQIAKDAEVARIHAEEEIQELTEKAYVQKAEERVLYGCNQKLLGVEVQRFQRQPIISYLRPFGCHVTILNTIDQLGKFDGKSDSGFLVRYSLNSKAFRVYNLETKRVKENLHVNFLENKLNVAGKAHAWMFDLDYLTDSMNYEPVSLENQANKSAGLQEANHSAGDKIGKNEKPVSPVEQIFHEELDKLKRQEKEANDVVRKEATDET